MFLKELGEFKRESALKPTTIKIRHRDGTLLEEKRDPDGNLVAEYIGKESTPAYLSSHEEGFSSIAPLCYNVAAGLWEQQQIVPVKEKKESETAFELTVVSFNVWFAEQEFDARARALLWELQHLEDQQPADVVCLQEVTPRLLIILLGDSWVREHYLVSDKQQGLTCYPYGVFMLVKKQMAGVLRFSGFTLHSLPSNMSRRFLKADFSLSGQAGHASDRVWLSIGTAHLESMNNPELRIAQMNLIFPILHSQSEHSLFMGDFNFSDAVTCPENEILRAQKEQHGWVDVWPALKPNTDGSSRGMGRIDKVLLLSQGCSTFAPEQITLLGTQKCGPDSVYPSDHYGLWCALKLK